MTNYYLQDDVFMTPSEAAYRWNVKRNTLIAALNRGRFNEYIGDGVKRFTQHGATEWLLSVKAMRDLFGGEDKVQVFELNNLPNETTPSRSAVYFNHRWLCMTNVEVDVTEEMLETFRTCESYESAKQMAVQFGFVCRSVEDIIGQMPLFGFPDVEDMETLKHNKKRAEEVIDDCLDELERSIQKDHSGAFSPYIASCKKLLTDVKSRL